MGRVVNATLRPLYPVKGRGTHCIRGRVGPRGGLHGCRKSRFHRDLIPGPYSPNRVAVPTELSRSYESRPVPFLPLTQCHRSGSCPLSVGAVCVYELRNILHVLPLLTARTDTSTSSAIPTGLPPSRCITSYVATHCSATTMVHSLCVLVLTATLVASEDSAVLRELYGKWGQCKLLMLLMLLISKLCERGKGCSQMFMNARD